MFTCTPLSSVEYYIESVSQAVGEGEEATAHHLNLGRDRASYYVDNGVGEAPGIWWTNAKAPKPGEPIPFVRTDDEVDSREFRDLAAGKAPITGDDLVQRQDGRRVGYDLQFSAEKSVSVLWAFGTANEKALIEQIQQKAVFAAMDHAQKEGMIVTRRGKGGEIRETPAELMAGTFLHTTSRSGDPQLHTHAVLLNVCRRADGTTGTLDTHELLVRQKELAAVYRLALIEGLERELGITVEKNDRNFRVAGIPESVCEVFSKRRQDILAAAEEIGVDTSVDRASAKIISMNTRGEKSDLPDKIELQKRWLQELSLEGWSPEVLWQSVEAASRMAKAQEPDPVSPIDAAVEEITKTHSVITDRNLIGTVLEHCQGRHMTLEQALTTAHAARKSRQLIELSGHDLDPGRDVNKSVYATPASIQEERTMLKSAIDRRNEREFVPENFINDALKKRPTMSEEQAALVRHALNKDGVSVVEGSAGTGKSFSLGAAAEAAREAGSRVWVTAPSHQAKGVVAEDTKTGDEHAVVLRSLLNRIGNPEHPQAIALSKKDVVILDEAGMVGTREMGELLRAADKAGAKVILSGDTRQLKPVASGAPMEMLVRTMGTQRIDEIRRQKEEWQRRASMDFAKGNIKEAVNAYVERDCVKIGRGAALRQELVNDYLNHARARPDDTRLVLARTHVEVRALNADLRELARQENRLTGNDITVQSLPSGKNPKATSLALAAGDRVIFGENIKAGGQTVRNNDQATITSIKQGKDGEEPILTFKFDRGFEVTARWNDLKRMEQQARDGRKNKPDDRPIRAQHAYAVTVHSAQGASVNRAFVLNSAGLDTELLYVAMTRHKDNATLYTDVTRMDQDKARREIQRDGAVAAVSNLNHLRAEDGDDVKSVSEPVSRDEAIRQIIYDGEQSSKKDNAADFMCNVREWATSAVSARAAVRRDTIERLRKLAEIPDKPKAVEKTLEMAEAASVKETALAAKRQAEEARRLAEEEARKAAQRGMSMGM